MNFQLKTWQKILLTLFCFGIAIIGFILKLPSAFRGYDKELHSAFYFCAAAFLNILFAKRNILIHAIIFGALYLFGMAIEHGQVLSKQLWQIPHGRYDPEDVQGNLRGLLLFSAVWLIYIAIYYLTKQNKQATPVDVANTAAEELVYEGKGKYFLLDYSPSHSEMIIRRIDKSDPAKVFNIDLFFKAVHHIQLPTNLEDISIYKVARKQAVTFKNPYNREAIYRIDDKNGNTAFIDASVFVVFHNELDILTSSLGDFTWSEGNKQIFSTTIKGD